MGGRASIPPLTPRHATTDLKCLRRDFMINGAHSIIYSRDAEADRDFLRDVLGLPNVDVGHGWLIFGLPPSEVAVHPGEKNNVHEFYLMCDDIKAFVAAMTKRRVECGPVLDRGWGLLSSVKLPGGGSLSIYEPRHTRPGVMKVGKRPTAPPATRSKSKPAGARKTPAKR